MSSVVVVGSINQDIVAYVERLPAAGETVSGSKSALHPGGKGANQAVAAARLANVGDNVRMIGRVGQDAFGDSLLKFLDSEGIDISGIGVTDEAGTGLGLISVDAHGENAIAVVPGANHRWGEPLAVMQLTASDVVVCQFEIPMAIVTAAFAQAKAVRATTILNPAPFQNVPADILAATDVLVLNEIETAQMLGKVVNEIDDMSIIPAARELLARGPHAVVVTLGKAGVLVVERDGEAMRIPGRSVKAVDTTGAGDSFVGALAAELLRGIDVSAAATFANAAAAISVTRDGAASSMPRRGEIMPQSLP
jgi:ribokinase